MNIAVVDYQSGNLSSVVRALQTVSPSSTIHLASTAEAINRADRVVLPGQGAVPQAMKALQESGLIETVRACFARKPLLGICVGMQLLFEHSEETTTPSTTDAHANQAIKPTPCLGLMAGAVKKFANLPAEFKIPHMGWSEVLFENPEHALWRGMAKNERFYFAHSFYCAPQDESIIAGRTDYGIQVASAIVQGAVVAVQFHPEKSGTAGLRLLKNFVEFAE